MSRFYGYADFGAGGVVCEKVADLLDRIDADDDDGPARELLEAVLASDKAKEILRKRCEKLAKRAADKLKAKTSEKLGTGQSSGKKSRGSGQGTEVWQVTRAASAEAARAGKEVRKAERAAQRTSASTPPPVYEPLPSPSPAPLVHPLPVKKDATPTLVGAGSGLLLLLGLLL